MLDRISFTRISMLTDPALDAGRHEFNINTVLGRVLPPEEFLRRRLAGELRQGYEDAQAPRPTPADIADRLKEWHEVRAAELKYLNSGSRKTYATYRAAEPEQRRAMLAERAASLRSCWDWVIESLLKYILC